MIKPCLILFFAAVVSSCTEEEAVDSILEKCRGISMTADQDGRNDFQGFAAIYDLGPVGQVVDIIPLDCEPCRKIGEDKFGFCVYHYGKFELNLLDDSLSGLAQSNRIAHLPSRDAISHVFRVNGSAEVDVTDEEISLNSIEFDRSEKVSEDTLRDSLPFYEK